MCGWMDEGMNDGRVVKILMYYLRLFQRVVYQQLMMLSSCWEWNFSLGRFQPQMLSGWVGQKDATQSGNIPSWGTKQRWMMMKSTKIDFSLFF